MTIEVLELSNHPEFAGHEVVVGCVDADSGLEAFIAVHDRTLGPALGGCRMFSYASRDAAITDVLRLSRGMTYKSAAAGLPLGGGKAVIIGDPKRDKTPALLEAMGRFIDTLNGKYITAEDSGTGVDDPARMATRTKWVAGVQARQLTDGTRVSGDPSPSTAYGVFVGIQAAARHRLGAASLDGLEIAVQGVGNVGRHLSRLLVNAGARLVISDVDTTRAEGFASELDARVVSCDDIHRQPVDVFAPCALGGVLNAEAVNELRAPIVAGAANNQLARPEIDEALRVRKILYAPDYVINAGGIIDVYYGRVGYDHRKVIEHIERTGRTLAGIFERAQETGKPTGGTADRIASERLHCRDVSNVA
ncbi:MAG: Glu/Leu/Phe/Val dehydrogenase [Pseudomonadales bacterium]|nr:Glu/Leu/Phe/Val dehydrogenase [Pseudomonadales bacterium]